jgi:Tol biopolymer transport system component
VADVSSGQEFVLFDGTGDLAVGAAFWSPAGDRILFDMHPANSHYSVMVINTDGANLTRIQRGAPGWTRSAAGWSPTGSHLLLEHRDHNLQDSYILRMTADGAGKTRLTPNELGAGLSRPRVRGWR